MGDWTCCDAVVPSAPRTLAPPSLGTTTSVRPAPIEPASNSDPRNVSRTPRARESNGGPPDAAGPEA